METMMCNERFLPNDFITYIYTTYLQLGQANIHVSRHLGQYD